MASLKLNRRAVLQGIGGATIGLPVLECMLNAHGTAYAQGATLPRRFAIVFAGQAIGGDGWAKDYQMINGNRFTEAGHFIAPAAAGRAYTITTPLQPLVNLREDFSVVSNMAIPFSQTSVEPADVPVAGAFRDFHGGGCSPLLSGTRSTVANFTCNGITSDQVIAQMNRGQTTFESLVYRAQPSWYLAGSSYSGRQYISYRGAQDEIEAQTSPAIAFQSLFNGFVPSGDANAARFEFQRRSRLSVLDLITRKRQALLARVGAADRLRLSEHFDEIRGLETRIAALPPVASGTCQVLPSPGADPAIGGDNAGSGSDMIGINTGYSNEHERARLFADLMHMAFVCDLTRAATLQVTVFQSHMNVYPITDAMGTPIRADLHEVGHNGDQMNRGQLAVSLVLQWQLSHFAYLVDKLKLTPEGAGNVLDNCALLFVPEAGHGLQLNDATELNQTHSVENMVMVLAGRAGGLRPGQHIISNRAHPVQTLVSAMQAAGYTGNTLGQVTGNIPELFT